MNCGRSAVKKTSALGFAAWSTKPFAKTRPARAGASDVDDIDRTRDRPMNAETPSQIRYAAPTHRTTEKSPYDAIRTAPRLVADSTKYIVLPARIPRFAQIDDTAPRARP